MLLASLIVMARHPRRVPRRGLRHAVDEEQRVGELRIAARQSAQHHRFEHADLRADDGARHVGNRLGQRLIVTRFDRGAIHDVRLRCDVADAQRCFGGRDLDAVQKVWRHLELDVDLQSAGRGLQVRHTQVQKARCLDEKHDRAGIDVVDPEPPDGAGRGGQRRALDRDGRSRDRLAACSSRHAPGNSGWSLRRCRISGNGGKTQDRQDDTGTHTRHLASKWGQAYVGGGRLKPEVFMNSL